MEIGETVGAVSLLGIEAVAKGTGLVQQNKSIFTFPADIVGGIVVGAVVGEAEGGDELES